MSAQNETISSSMQLSVPPFISIADVTEEGSNTRQFVISNEATGRYFDANESTVLFLQNLKKSQPVVTAMAQAGILPALQNALLKPLLQAGVVVVPGKTTDTPTPKAPIEGKLISARFDLFDAEPIARRFRWIGAVAYSPSGYGLWLLTVLVALYQVATQPEKVALAMRALPDMGWYGFVLFGLIYIGLKCVHELGHALAYQQFCKRSQLSTGPIRMGLAIFAMTPFPFTDVTGAWRLRSRGQRAMIGAGGMYLETWAIAVLALIWSQIQSGPVQTIILQVAVVASFFTLLFNLNPAVKLDGYYILTDLLRRPNLAMRASKAARSSVARLLGDQTSINSFDLSYWGVSYLYRWSIFAGIFWLSYQFDPRLAAVMAVITAMMLVVRPIWATLQYLRQRKVSPLRAIIATTAVACTAAALAIPFQDRLLLQGRLHAYETRFIEPTETGTVARQDDVLEIQSPELLQQLAETKLQAEIVRNTARTVAATAQEQAALAEDIKRLTETENQVTDRLGKLSITLSEDTFWTPMDADRYLGAMVTRASITLGAASQPITPYLSLSMDQKRLDSSIDLTQDAELKIRLRHLPSCKFSAVLEGGSADFTTQPGFITLRARPEPGVACASGLRSGSAVVARLETPPKSILRRIHITASRLLQDRLPVKIN